MTANEVLARFSEQQVAAFFLVLARISPLFILAPLFSSKMIPGRVRTIVAVGLAVGLMPVVKHGAIDLDPLAFGGMIVKEVVVGLAFAYALAAMFAGLQVAGSLLDTLIGFSFGSLVDPVTGNQSTVIAQLYSLFGVAILIAIGAAGVILIGLVVIRRVRGRRRRSSEERMRSYEDRMQRRERQTVPEHEAERP